MTASGGPGGPGGSGAAGGSGPRGHDPWRDPEVRRRMWMRRRRHGWGPGDGGWGPGRRGPVARGFGCLSAVVFVVVASSIFFVVGSVLARVGPLPGLIAIAAGALFLIAVGRGLRGAARALDRIVDAAGRVEDGDYSVRIGPPGSELPPIRALAASFDTMVERLGVDEAQQRSLLADVSHELRTPLTVMTGHLEAIIDGVYPADEAHLAPILEETHVLSRLIDDLRTVALSEAGTLALHPEPTDPDVLVAEVLRSFRAVADAGGVTLQTEVIGDLPIIEIDPVRIREVLSNLVANALRHTPTGGTVTLGGGAATEAVTLTVADTGSGIDPALQPYVFDRFVKGETSRGSGLGLAIAKGLVEAHGGTIAVWSSATEGTTFTVTLPRDAADD